MPTTPKQYPNTNVFINKLKLTETKRLASAEADFSLLRTEQYRSNPPPASFDLEHLRGIHRQLFSDLYEWAGELRGYNIRKGICEFTPHEDIQRYADKIYRELEGEDYLTGLRMPEMTQRLAYYYDMTNRLHPFPEGNGRTQRLFIEHLAAAAGFNVDWSSTHAWQIVEVAVQSFEDNFEPAVMMFEEITTSMPPASNWTQPQGY